MSPRRRMHLVWIVAVFATAASGWANDQPFFGQGEKVASVFLAVGAAVWAGVVTLKFFDEEKQARR